MPIYRLSSLAEKDLFNIISATIEYWGNTQAKEYAQTMDTALVKLAQYPEFGRERNDVYTNYVNPLSTVLSKTP